MDYAKISNVKVSNVDMRDFPDFCDAYIASADYDGRPMTEDQLNELNENSDFVYKAVQNYLY